VLKFATKFLDY